MDEEIKEILEAVISFLDEIETVEKMKPSSLYEQACMLHRYQSAIANKLGYRKEEIEEAVEAHTY
tara:strand:+ start:773 stop:967 length:195 start_codon:yes stop_codon:yes gene_type:complete